MSDNQLLSKIKESMQSMQSQMQSAYTNMATLKETGVSHDGSVQVIVSATYELLDLEFDERALQGGVKEFKWRLREAWKDVMGKIQKLTQTKTLELLQGMHIPEEIRQISSDESAS